MYPWLLPHQATSVQGHGSPPGRGNILPLLPGLLQLVSYSKTLSGKWFSASGASCTPPGQRPRLRPLYQYINFDMPELMDPSAEEVVPGLAQPSQVPAAPGRATAPHLEGELQGLPSSCIPPQGPGLVLPVACWSLQLIPPEMEALPLSLQDASPYAVSCALAPSFLRCGLCISGSLFAAALPLGFPLKLLGGPAKQSRTFHPRTADATIFRFQSCFPRLGGTK